MEYEGWTNWETWNVNLWLMNDPRAFSEAMMTVREGHISEKLVRARLLHLAKQYVEDEVDFNMVNWHEIVENFRQAIEDVRGS